MSRSNGSEGDRWRRSRDDSASRASRPPEAWRSAHNLARRILRPIETFLHVQAASGLLLLVATAVALFWANSAWRDGYTRVWHAPVTLGVGPFVHRASIHFWINDGLMVIFFFVVGLEIRREMYEGELADLRRAALPVAAALGGMIAPAATFFALNAGTPASRGWGVPMATDIAFAVGVLALLGRRVPPAIRVLLLALAIIDDIGAIVVIALFYSSALAWSGLAIVAVGVLAVLILQRFGARNPALYVAPGLVVWLGVLRAGIHPTIAGVILGLLTPARAWFGPEGFAEVMHDVSARARDHVREGAPADDLRPSLDQVGRARREALSPVTRLQAVLHPWVAFGIMPLFALANAGVTLEGFAFDETSFRLVLGVVLGLVVGKPLGIVLAGVVAVRLGIATLPRGVTLRGLTLVGIAAGIGFTMALFIAELAFGEAPILAAARLGVLVASGLAALIALALGATVLLRGIDLATVAPTAEEAEAEAER
ncbi:MAG: Na+/H+ antiporter NhaA [Deltaproteobacteria bacterium]|nr:Na+/H+ antiporter NhaA [Deltaproteobacteria bacterium]